MAGAQLRCYRIVAGGLDDFVALFHEQLVPLRAQYGFRVHGPWVDRAANRFVWVAENVGAGTYPDGLIPFTDPDTGQPLTTPASLAAVPFSVTAGQNPIQ